MKGYLILFSLVAGASAHGQGASAGSVLDSTSASALAKPASPAPSTVPERHLSEQQRAELRRQLDQFNRQYAKRQ